MTDVAQPFGGVMFMCSRRAPRGQRCQRVEFVPPQKEDTTSMPRTCGWICRIPGCPIEGRRQAAPTRDAAAAGWRRHYLADHYEPRSPFVQ